MAVVASDHSAAREGFDDLMQATDDTSGCSSRVKSCSTDAPKVTRSFVYMCCACLSGHDPRLEGETSMKCLSEKMCEGGLSSRAGCCRRITDTSTNTAKSIENASRNTAEDSTGTAPAEKVSTNQIRSGIQRSVPDRNQYCAFHVSSPGRGEPEISQVRSRLLSA